MLERGVRSAVVGVLVVLGCSQTDPPQPAGMSASGSGAAAQGGGGAAIGGSTSLPDAATAAQDAGPTADYFPVRGGSQIKTRHIDAMSTWDEDTTVTAMQYKGMAAFELAGSPDPNGQSTKSILIASGTQWLRVAKDVYKSGVLDSNVEYQSPGFVRFDAAWYGLSVGATVTHGYTRVETPVGGAAVTQMNQHKFTIAAKDEAVTVPAGAFEHCLRVHRERVLGPADMPMPDDVKDYWFCPGVGRVKEALPGSSSTEELVSCTTASGSCF